MLAEVKVAVLVELHGDNNLLDNLDSNVNDISLGNVVPEEAAVVAVVAVVAEEVAVAVVVAVVEQHMSHVDNILLGTALYIASHILQGKLLAGKRAALLERKKSTKLKYAIDRPCQQRLNNFEYLSFLCKNQQNLAKFRI